MMPRVRTPRNDCPKRLSVQRRLVGLSLKDSDCQGKEKPKKEEAVRNYTGQCPSGRALGRGEEGLHGRSGKGRASILMAQKIMSRYVCIYIHRGTHVCENNDAQHCPAGIFDLRNLVMNAIFWYFDSCRNKRGTTLMTVIIEMPVFWPRIDFYEGFHLPSLSCRVLSISRFYEHGCRDKWLDIYTGEIWDVGRVGDIWFLEFWWWGISNHFVILGLTGG